MPVWGHPVMNWEDGGRSVTYLLTQRFKEERPSQNRMREQKVKGWKVREREEQKTQKDFERHNQHRKIPMPVITERSMLQVRGETTQRGEVTRWRTRKEKTLCSCLKDLLATLSNTIVKVDSFLATFRHFVQKWVNKSTSQVRQRFTTFYHLQLSKYLSALLNDMLLLAS